MTARDLRVLLVKAPICQQLHVSSQWPVPRQAGTSARVENPTVTPRVGTYRENLLPPQTEPTHGISSGRPHVEPRLASRRGTCARAPRGPCPVSRSADTVLNVLIIFNGGPAFSLCTEPHGHVGGPHGAEPAVGSETASHPPLPPGPSPLETAFSWGRNYITVAHALSSVT